MIKIKSIFAEEVDMVPTQRKGVAEMFLINRHTGSRHGLKGLLKVNGVRDGNGSDEQHQATGPMHLVVQEAVVELPQLAEKEGTRQTV